MGGSFLWVLLLLCVGFFWGQVVSQQQPEEQSESYKTANSGGGVSKWLSSPSTSNWDGKPGRKEEVYKRCSMEGMILAKLPNGLFFSNGYWEQSPETPPILPYSPPAAADGDKSGMSTQPDHPVHVASFQLLKNAGRASGNKEDTMWASLVLEITAGMDTITRVLNNTSSNDGGIHTQPGYSSLTIRLEGLMYTKQGEEEISLCMLGCRSLMPPAAADSSFPTTAATSTQDCNVMLHLQFPNKLSLTKRVIRAQITSLSDEHDKHFYFHPVNVTALSEIFMQSYEYTVGDVVAQVCNDPNSGSGKEASEAQEGPLPMEDRFSGPQFLQALQQLLVVQLDVEPSLNCSESEEFCDNLGPFGSGRFATPAANHQLKEQERSVSKTRVVFHNFRFSEMPDDAVTVTTDLSAVERNVSAVILASQQTLGRQSGMYPMWFDNHTLVAEGLWKDKTKQVCMVACQVDAVIANVSSECNIRICLEIAINLSLERRSLVLGTISSTRLQHNEPGSFNSLLISRAFHYMYFPFEVRNKLHYTFNHLEEAYAFQGKFEPDAGWLTTTTMKVIASKYPALRGNKSEHYYALNDELSISSLLIPKSGQSKKNLALKIDVIAIEDHITTRYGRMDEMVVWETVTDDSDLRGKKKETPQMGSLKVAAQIMIAEGWGFDDPLVKYAAEGWYEPKDGKMYMVGCRAVNANWTMLQDNKRFLKGRLDCELTLLLEYPSTVARWLSPSTVKVSIKSKRNTDDAFYFLETSYETFPIAYMQQRKDSFFRNNLEGVLSAGTLSVMFICIVVQLVHIGRNHDSAPFISLGMLGVQAIGYMIPLLTEAEALFARNQPRQFAADQWSQRIKFTTKLLTLLAFLLILRLIERVWKERVSQAQKAELNTTQKNSPPPPQESNVILVCGIVHLVSFLLIFAVHTIKSHASESSGTTELIRWNGQPITMQKEAKEYWGLVEDLFLFPQVVGNAIWEVKGKPLHPMYYIGITILRLLPHLYDRLRRPLLSPFDVNFAYANPDADFYTRNADIVIPLLAIVLVLLVYFQQKWKGWLVLPSRRLYSKLPVKNAETELVSTQIPGATVFSEDPEDHDEE
ncbi:unnamed protein product [Sphagnum tenellum]